MNQTYNDEDILMSPTAADDFLSSRRPEIGGFLSLDSRRGAILPNSEGWFLNSGRRALQFILHSMPEVNTLWIPAYYCKSVIDMLAYAGVAAKTYDVDGRLEIRTMPALADNEAIVVVNYFGVKDRYVASLASRYGKRLVVDNCQAWYAPAPSEGYAFYSPRKFFGVADGGLAVGQGLDGALYENLPRSESYNRCLALLKRIDLGARAAYEDHLRENEEVGAEKMMRISRLTYSMLRNEAFGEIRQKRLQNFQHLHSRLGNYNKLSPAIDFGMKGPLVYPLWTDDFKLREYLISNDVFIATYWPWLEEMPEGSEERRLADHILPLPIDQRYDFNDMERILSLLQSY